MSFNKRCKGLMGSILLMAVCVCVVAMGCHLCDLFTNDAIADRASGTGPVPFDGTVSTVNGLTHIYHWGALPAPTKPYTRYYNRMTDQVYNSTTKQMESESTISWVDTETMMTDKTLTVGGWRYNKISDVANTGNGFLPKGWYDVMTYEMAGATPASTDTLYVGRFCKIENGYMQSFDNR